MQHQSFITLGASARPLAWDITYPTTDRPLPLILFLHGFRGFKDWGTWSLIAKQFAAAGYAFAKMNFSHNGVTPDHPQDFVDLEAFGQNNFSKEMEDVQAVLKALCASDLPIQKENIAIIGHSRGGAIALLTAAEEERIGRVSTWASVARLDYAWANQPEKIEMWQREGVIHSLNTRTNQQMPLNVQLYHDYEAHRSRFHLPAILPKLRKPLLVVHGNADTAVPLVDAIELASLAPRSTLRITEGADHVFGGKHPFEEEVLPKHSAELVEEVLVWLQGA